MWGDEARFDLGLEKPLLDGRLLLEDGLDVVAPDLLLDTETSRE